ncbi:MAG TPA: sugar ABC transporter substrate-binding protein [Acetobacteraceae bacterium]|jgi:simple sugar transport system substrate-binding protein|nr:sugar ABC transporter substrate-binding protein [Acetobacteraceae bacterium]
MGHFDRRDMLRTAGLAGTLALLAGDAARAATEGAFPSHPKWRLVFVNHVTTNPFFVPTQNGIKDACDLLGCTYQWTGSANADVAEMVNAMNAAIAAKADAIAVPIVDPHAFNAPTAKALEAGVPVFSYNADAPPGSDNKRLAYIGQDLYQSGYRMGERIAATVDAGLVAIFIATPGQLNIQPRMDGATAAIKKSGKMIDVQSIASGPTVNEELSRIRSFYLGHQDLKGMYAVDAGSTQGVGEVMQQFNLPSKGVHAGGYDLLPKTLELIKAGFLDFTIDQQAYLQGFYTAIEMFTFLASGGLTGPADINTGLKFVTKDSVGPYLTSKTRYEGSSLQPQIVARSGPISG